MKEAVRYREMGLDPEDGQDVEAQKKVIGQILKIVVVNSIVEHIRRIATYNANVKKDVWKDDELVRAFLPLFK